MNERPNLIFLDVETTGIEADDRLCQLAFKIRSADGTVYQSEALFKPPKPMSVEAMSVCHITNKMLADKNPFSAEGGLRDYLQLHFNKPESIFVAHNAQFDMGFLLKEGMTLPARHICTMKLAHHHDKKAELQRHTLQFLRYLYELEFDTEINPHDAMSDVLVLEKLYDWYTKHYTIEEMVEISSKPILYKKMPFGKYKDKFFKEIALMDMDYLLWMRRAMTLDGDMKYTVEYYINNR